MCHLVSNMEHRIEFWQLSINNTAKHSTIHTMKDRQHHQKLISAVAIANLIALLGLIAAIFFNAEQIRGQNVTLTAQEHIASANYILKLSDELNGPRYAAIMAAIENGNEHTPIVSGTHPPFTQTQMENYMGNFETIGDLVQEGVINGDMAYQEFSYDTAKAWCNRDVQSQVQADIASDPSEPQQDQYWSGFRYIATYFMGKDRMTCAGYDGGQ